MKKRLIPLILTVFIDLLGFGIVIPIFAPLITDPERGILSTAFDQNKRNMIYGLLVATYPIAQFFSAPILGTLSDYYGRKKILLVSISGTLVNYILMIVGILTANIWIIFIARLIDGLTGGNISVANSAIADLSDDKSRTKNFGLIGMAFGLGFILGPLIGGKLADSNTVSWFGSWTPFLFAGALAIVNIFLLFVNFEETLKLKKKGTPKLSTGFLNLYKAFRESKIEQLFLVVFLMNVGFSFFSQLFQLYLMKRFSYKEADIGMLFAYIGIWIVITQGFFIKPLAKRFNSIKVLKVSLLLLGIFLPFLLLPNKPIYLLLVMPFVAVSNGISVPNLTSLISSMSNKKIQGEILGVNQSLQSIAIAITPLVGTLLFNLNPNYPIIGGSITVLLAWLVFVVYFRNEKLN